MVIANNSIMIWVNNMEKHGGKNNELHRLYNKNHLIKSIRFNL